MALFVEKIGKTATENTIVFTCQKFQGAILHLFYFVIYSLEQTEPLLAAAFALALAQICLSRRIYRLLPDQITHPAYSVRHRWLYGCSALFDICPWKLAGLAMA